MAQTPPYPPRLLGEPVADLIALREWLWQFFKATVVETGLLDPTSAASGGGGGSGLIPGIRLSLAEDVAVTESDMAGANAVYGVPTGNPIVPIWTGSAFAARSFSGSLLLGLDPSTHGASKEFSIFAHGTDLALGTSQWASSTAPADVTELLNGFEVNADPIVLHNAATGPVTIEARKATLIGGVATTAIPGQTEDSQEKRLLSNLFSAADRAMQRFEGADSWQLLAGTMTFRQANDNTRNCLEFFFACGGRLAYASLLGLAQSASSTLRSAGVGIALDVTDTVDANSAKAQQSVDNTRVWALHARRAAAPGVGRHRLNWINWAGTPPAASTEDRTFVGDAGDSIVVQAGLTGWVVN